MNCIIGYTSLQATDYTSCCVNGRTPTDTPQLEMREHKLEIGMEIPAKPNTKA